MLPLDENSDIGWWHRFSLKRCCLLIRTAIRFGSKVTLVLVLYIESIWTEILVLISSISFRHNLAVNLATSENSSRRHILHSMVKVVSLTEVQTELKMIERLIQILSQWNCYVVTCNNSSTWLVWYACTCRTHVVLGGR